MPVRASVQALPDPGHAILRLTELQASPDGLTLSIQRQQGPDSHLADDGWRRTETWLQPARVRRVKDVLEFDLGPEICDRLAGVATVRLRVKEPDIGVVGTTVVAWPTMLTSGAANAGSHLTDDTVRLKRVIKLPPEEAPVVEPPPPPPPEPEPVPELRAERPLVPPAEPGSTREWLIAAVLLIVAIGAGYWAYTNYFQAKPEQQAASEAPATAEQQPPAATAAAEPPKKSVRDTVNEYFAGKPAPDAMYAKGKEFAQGGDLSAAFLVWRRAAESGSVQAQVEMAAFYDPINPQPKSGFVPDGARAAEWYERAALAGNVEAQRRYGLLLAKGGPGLPADVAKARTWLQQAAAQNDADAKKALDALPK
jgi:hypothetical protein